MKKQNILAGITSATVIVPKAMAYATVAGLSVAVGLYTCIVPVIVYALLGTSQVLSVTSTTTLAILTASEMQQISPSPDAAALPVVTLTFLVGTLLLIAAVFRLGFVANFISTPVLIGFKAGIGLVILLDQVPKLLGLHITKNNFFSDLTVLFQELGQSHLPTLLLALGCFALYFGLKSLAPRSPVPLLIVAAGILVSWLMPSSEIATIGTVPSGLPSLQWPSWSLLAALLPGAVGIALMSFTESAAVARAFHESGDPRIQPNRELLATGAANLIGAFAGSMPAGGGASQTAVVRGAGGTHQTANLIVAILALATLLFLSPVMSLLPQAVLAAIVMIYSVGLIQIHDFQELYRIRNMEFRWALASCLGVLLFGTLKGIIVAIAMSLLGLASQTVVPRVSVIGKKRNSQVFRPFTKDHPTDELFGDLLVIRPEGSVFFLNAQSVGAKIMALIDKYQPRIVVIDMSRIPDLEYSALKTLIDGEKKLRASDIICAFASLNPSVLEMVRRAGWDQEVGDRLFFNIQSALDFYRPTYVRPEPFSPSDFTT